MPYDRFGLYGMDQKTDYRSPRRVRLTVGCVYLETYFGNNDRGTVAKAREILDRHNIELDVFTGFGIKSSWNTIPNTKERIPDEPAAYKVVYQAAKAKLRQMGCNYTIPLPIVFGEFLCGGYAIAPKVPGELTRLCMISASGNSDQIDLLHEMGHAAGLGHDGIITSPRNFMDEASPRSTMYQFQVEAFAKAPFSVG